MEAVWVGSGSFLKQNQRKSNLKEAGWWELGEPTFFRIFFETKAKKISYMELVVMRGEGGGEWKENELKL